MHIMIPPPLISEFHCIWNKVTTALEGQEKKFLRGEEKH